MKTMIAALMLLISTSGLCHEIQQAGCVGNRLKYLCSGFQDNGHAFVKVSISSGTWGDGSSDTIFALPANAAFTIYVPYPLSGSQTITFKNTNHNGNANGETHVVIGTPCHSLPLKFGNIWATRLTDDLVRVYVKVYSVENVKEIRINVSIDGEMYQTLATIIPEQGAAEKTYSSLIKIKK